MFISPPILKIRSHSTDEGEADKYLFASFDNSKKLGPVFMPKQGRILFYRQHLYVFVEPHLLFHRLSSWIIFLPWLSLSFFRWRFLVWFLWNWTRWQWNLHYFSERRIAKSLSFSLRNWITGRSWHGSRKAKDRSWGSLSVEVRFLTAVSQARKETLRRTVEILQWPEGAKVLPLMKREPF